MTIVNGVGLTDDTRNVRMRRKTPPRQLAPTEPTVYFRRKAWFDRSVAFLLLIPGLPIIAVLVALIRLTSRGPGIFRQQRVGEGGKVFTMLKLRSMRVDAEHRSGAIWATDDDPRTTWLGKYLRKFHLDELPQLFNVLAGQMSLIGPRPERPEFVSVLSAALPHYTDRLLVPPGVTGLAQINLPPDSDLNSVARKLALDLEYVEAGSLWLDVRLLFCTIARVVKFGTSFCLRILGVHRDLKNHPKFVAPDASCLQRDGSALSANELADRLVEQTGETIDGRIADALEDTIEDEPAHHEEGNGEGNGHAGRNGKRGNGTTPHSTTRSRKQHPR